MKELGKDKIVKPKPKKSQPQNTNAFSSALRRGTRLTRTENQAVAYNTTGSAVLNLFALGGALASRNVEDIVALVSQAYQEDKQLATKLFFYLSDIRGGQKRRRMMAITLDYLAKKDPAVARQILRFVPHYSRWDLLYVCVGTPIEDDMWNVIKEQLKEDIKSESPSLMAKWLKSVNTSSAMSNALGLRTAKALGMTPKEYRKTLSALRKRINVTEVHMSANRWGDIDFNTVPGVCFSRHFKAWNKHKPTELDLYLQKAESGEVKTKASTLYPHDILRMALDAADVAATSTKARAAEVLWRDQPDYINGNDGGIIVVNDTSGSMRGLPMDIGIALSIYCAERLKGPYHNMGISFSSRPELYELRGASLYAKYRNVPQIVENTNIEAVFDLLLNLAIRNGSPQSDIPSKILLISDMEFDQANQPTNWWGQRSNSFTPFDATLFEKIKKKWAQYGYHTPDIIFWNVAARNNQHPMEQNSAGVALVSGYSPSILETVLTGEVVSPYDVMLRTLNKERYDLLNSVQY